MSADKYSVSKLAEFWDYVIQKGLMKKNTAVSRKLASLKVLDALDASEKQDLRTLDREAVFTRFENISGKQYSPESLTVYRSRFNTGLNEFLKYLDSPSDYRPGRVKTNGKPKKETIRPRKTTEREKQVATRRESENQESNLPIENLTLPIPLRQGVVVKIFGLPSDLSEDEAKKISGIISAYAFSLKGVNPLPK